MKGIAVRLEGLSKYFGRVAALRTLDLDIHAGEMVAFLGPSGCGKTTTLLMVAGIYQPSSGAIYFGERRVEHLHPRDRDVGMVFQSYALYPHLTLLENIAFPLRLKRVPADEVAAKVRQTAELLGIGHVLERRPAHVSGGQQQRAALARALVKEPQVLLLDEPLSNLDANLREEMRYEIRRLHDEFQITTVYEMRWGAFHFGVDMAAPYGTPYYAAHAGTVTLARYEGGYGNAIRIDHGNGIETVYGHSSKLLVTEGQHVEAGQMLGLIGSTGYSTGNHLHFEVTVNGEHADPMAYLLAHGVDIAKRLEAATGGTVIT